MEEKLSDSKKILKRLEEVRIGENVSSNIPKVSIIIPAYNISEFIEETLDSIFAQTFKDFEIIVVNDGSEDSVKLESVLEKYADRIIYGVQKNLGASKARNTAICLSRSDLITFLDGDDIYFPKCLEKQLSFIEENELDMTYCDAELIGENYLNDNTYMRTTPSNGEVTPISLLDGSCNVLTSGTVIRRKTLAELGLFDSQSARAQDFDLWFRIAKQGRKIHYNREILIQYRMSSVSLSGSNVERAERTVEVLHIVRNKYDFTPNEHKVWQRQIALSEAECELEKAKFNLIQGNYLKAEDNVAKANVFFKKPKLSVLKFFIKFAPKLTLKLFQKLRPAEFSFIAPKKS